ncbi:MAG TPA: hypothetical protein V6C81_16215 [Planktothrix sp.]
MDLDFFHRPESTSDHKDIDPAVLSKEMYNQQALKEWTHTFGGKSETVSKILERPGSVSIIGEKGDDPPESSTVQRIHKDEKIISDILDKQAHNAIDKIINGDGTPNNQGMSEQDREEYMKEEKKYKEDMQRYYATGTLLSPEPEKGDLAKQYDGEVSTVVGVLEQRAVDLDQKYRKGLSDDDKKALKAWEDEKAKREEEERRRAGTFM